jgi:hypothetical protein
LKDEVVCDVSPLDVCDVFLRQPYMCKRHVVYGSQPCSFIITLAGHIYRIPELFMTIVPPKQCCKVISHAEKFIIFTIYSKDAHKSTTTTENSTPSIQKKNIVEDKTYIISSPTIVPTQ